MDAVAEIFLQDRISELHFRNNWQHFTVSVRHAQVSSSGRLELLPLTI
ncbi:hypothetical protein M758_4G062000 [Ceratodon purpureus]|nr:hypothetical protein M758_N024500 [Ceratodon purpureus]KAG0618412.1 hypothetical protein M758_4G062000 [Ceratodon purpureus]